MAGIFVEASDGGVGPSGASNAFTPHNAPSCTPLFYPNTCGARVTSDWLNAILSEIGQAVDNAGLTINCGVTDNLNRAMMTHALTRGWCGTSRADAETQKGGALVTGEFYLNTSTGVVYVIDVTNTEWALPNQPSSFLCCATGSLWANCGGTWTEVIGGVTGTIPATDVDVTACADGPINADTDLQSAICALSSSIAAPSASPIDRAIFSCSTDSGTSGWWNIDNVIYARPWASLPSNGIINIQAGRYMLWTLSGGGGNYAYLQLRLNGTTLIRGTRDQSIGDPMSGIAGRYIDISAATDVEVRFVNYGMTGGYTHAAYIIIDRLE